MRRRRGAGDDEVPLMIIRSLGCILIQICMWRRHPALLTAEAESGCGRSWLSNLAALKHSALLVSRSAPHPFCLELWRTLGVHHTTRPRRQCLRVALALSS